jgi:hypothetical protein
VFCENVGQFWYKKQHVDNMLMVYHQKCPYEIGYKKFVPFPYTQMLKNWNGM